MASKTIKLTVTSNKIVLPIDNIFFGKYVKITISDKVAPPKRTKKNKRPMKRIIVEKKQKFILPKVDTSKLNINIIEDEPYWNSDKPMDKNLDILGHSEKRE